MRMIEMGRCRACGAECDGDVCDTRCANELYEQQEAIPSGHNRCAGCGELSRLYDLFPHCRECFDEFCPQCSVGPVDDETNSTICKGCAEAARAEAS